MSNNPLISIIMPARNAGEYIAQAIRSVVDQSWTHWELLVVDNASTDDTASIADSFGDQRIRVLLEPQVGISHARNCALKDMRGDFFCFLDADDLFPQESLYARAHLLMGQPDIEFADGFVEYWNKTFAKFRYTCKPSLRGVPYLEVASLRGSCLCAVSWMIRRVPGKHYHFHQHWTHSEDIAFFLDIGRTGRYDFVTQSTYKVRRGHTSTMSNLVGLEDSYHQLLNHVRTLEGLPENHDVMLRKKVRSIIFKSYLKKCQPMAALKSWIRFNKEP